MAPVAAVMALPELVVAAAVLLAVLPKTRVKKELLRPRADTSELCLHFTTDFLLLCGATDTIPALRTKI